MRLTGLDIARFLAFTGMVLVNFRIAAQVSGTNDWAAQITQLLEGRAAALFVVLAGVGITLANAPAKLMVKRALFLSAIGLLNQTIFEADILHYYGVYFLCAIPFDAALFKHLGCQHSPDNCHLPRHVAWLELRGRLELGYP